MGIITNNNVKFMANEYLEVNQLANTLNYAFGELQKTDNYSRLSAEYKQILLGMNLADDYFREKKKNQILEDPNPKNPSIIYSLHYPH